jgi:hypothetical protein
MIRKLALDSIVPGGAPAFRLHPAISRRSGVDKILWSATAIA